VLYIILFSPHYCCIILLDIITDCVILLDKRNFLEDFVRQSLLPLTVPINTETLKMLNDDERKVVLAILEDDSDEKSAQLVKVLRSAASANRDLVFGYVGVKQWEGFVETFDISKSSQLPKLLVWDRNEEYELVSKMLLQESISTS
jgi:protein disulfide-isomerase A1